MKKQELSEWLNIKEGKNFQIQMPNEIFEDFNNLPFKNFKHKCFAYAYYYLCSYLYRTLAYRNPLRYRQEDIISVLVTNYDRFLYITKKNGLLEKANYIETTSDFPVNIIPFEYVDENGIERTDEKIIEFELISMIKKISDSYPKVPNNYSIRKPVKALKRYGKEDDDFTGTFYNIENTHFVSIESFVEIITNKSLGYVGLFIYAYISMANDKFKNGYQISYTDLANIVGCKDGNTIARYIKELEKNKLILSRRHQHKNKHLEKVFKINDKNDWRTD